MIRFVVETRMKPEELGKIVADGSVNEQGQVLAAYGRNVYRQFANPDVDHAAFCSAIRSTAWEVDERARLIFFQMAVAMVQLALDRNTPTFGAAEQRILALLRAAIPVPPAPRAAISEDITS